MSLESRLLSLVQAIGADIKSLFTGKADTSHTHSAATTSVAGFMSAADKTKLNGIATSANNYTHPTGDGKLHVPATGTTNAGKVLTAGATAGSISWQDPPAGSGGLTYTQADKDLVDNSVQNFVGRVEFTTVEMALLNNAVQNFVGRVEFTTVEQALLNNAVQDFVGRVEFTTTELALVNNAVQQQVGYGLSQNDFTNYYVGELDTLIANSGGGDPSAPYQKDTLIDSDLLYVSPPSDNRLRIIAKDTGGRTVPEVIGWYGDRFPLQESTAYNTVSFWQAAGNSTVVTMAGITTTATGTVTQANIGFTNIHTFTKRLEYAVTTASATAVAGLRQTALQYVCGSGSIGGFHFVATFGPSRGVAANATRRFFAGMTSTTAAPTDVQPSTWAADAIGVGADSTDTEWQIMHRTGTGAMTKVNTGITKSTSDSTTMYRLSIFSPKQGGARVFVRFENLGTGEVFNRTITTSLPALSTPLTWQIWTSVGGTSSVIGVSIARVYISTPY